MAGRAVIPSTFAVLAGNALHDEFKALSKTIWQRGRKRFANYVLGPQTYYRNSNRKMVDRSLGRLRSVRRRSTRTRLSRRYARRKRRAPYRRVMRRTRARRAMGTNGPAFRSRLKFSRYRAQLGQQIGYCPSRRSLKTGGSSLVQDKRLDQVRLVNIPYSDTDNVMNTRTGRICDVSGVKFRAWFSLKDNLIESSGIWDNPIHIRWAIVNPRENTGEQADVTAGTNWFMSDNPGEDDTTDFPSTGNCFKYMNRKINTRRYGVLQEGTFLLANDPAASNTRVDMRSKKFLTFWLPIKRQMKWGNNGTLTQDAYPNANIHFVMWYVAMGDKDTAQKFSGSQPFDFTYERITYFKNAEVLSG